MERYQLRYFLAVVDEGNFSRAATYCRVSQPTLSAGVAKLERQLGTRLFVRSNQRVELTDGGARLLSHARRIEREFSLAQQALGGTAPSQVLRIGLLNSVPGALSAAALAACATEAVVEFLPGSERDLASLLARGRIDVSLTLLRGGKETLVEQPLIDEGYGLAMPSGHRLAALDVIAPEDLGSDVMIVRRHCEVLSETSRHFTERGVRPRFALRSTNDEWVMQMIAAGLGVTVMPDSHRHEGVRRAKLAGFDVRRTLGFRFAAAMGHLSHEPPVILQALAKEIRAAGRSDRADAA